MPPGAAQRLWLSLSTQDPSFNLALEEHLFSSLPPEQPGLFLLWQNAPSIIVGRHPCTAEEVNEEFVRREHLPVIRRMTGGGAVYHDAGNLNFSFIERLAGHGRMNFAHYLEPICRALVDVGVSASLSGRNDLEVDGRKISGSSQRLAAGKVLHHGTLLVSADFARLGEALRPDPEKIRSKGVASVMSRVGNIADYWRPGTTMELLRERLCARCAAGRAELHADDTAAAMLLAEDKYRQWSWNWGASPPFSEERRQRFPWGTVCLRLRVERGYIASCRVYGDFFAEADMAELERRLVGLPRAAETLLERLGGIPWERYFVGCDAAAMLRFFAA